MSFPAAIALATCVAGCLAGCHKPKPTPSIDGLTDALNRTAEKELAAPSLANEQIFLTATPGQIDTQASQVLDAALAAGGVGIRSVDDKGRVSILATIPENNTDAFKATIRHEKSPMNSPAPTTTLIEILIQSSALPKPQPSPHAFEPILSDSSSSSSPSPGQ
jgi:hypothetical protein